MDREVLTLLADRYQAIIFDVGNTLVRQSNPHTSKDDLKVELLSGVREAITALNERFRLALVSNTTNLKSSDILRLLHEVELADFFEVCIATSEIGIHKPQPEPILAALEKLNLAPHQALYVGDNETDQIAATAAGLDFLYTQGEIRDALNQFAKYPKSAFMRAIKTQVNFDQEKYQTALRRFDELVKPKGSLGQLENLTARICAITGSLDPCIDPAAIAVFAADHGIAKTDLVTPWPQEITGMMTNLIAERRAAISVISEVNDVYLQVINVGTISEVLNPLVKDKRITQGTKDFRFEAAMSLEQVQEALEIGAETAERLVASGSRTLCCGEVGIGNTTASAILIAHFAQKSAREVTGFGSGINQATFERKVALVDQQIEKLKKFSDPVKVLAQVGGLEIAALVGFILRGSTLKVPVILDGVITLAAAMVAQKLKPEITSSIIAGHCSVEPGARVALEFLNLEPILTMNLRLGEGTGAALSIPILRTGCELLKKMGKLSEVI